MTGGWDEGDERDIAAGNIVVEVMVGKVMRVTIIERKMKRRGDGGGGSRIRWAIRRER